MSSSAVPGSIGPYRILRVLGSGGMGVVYLAEHSVSGQRAALKTVHVADALAVAAIRREVHSLARLEHPAVVRVLGDGVEDGVPWYAMERVEGRNLRDVLDELWRSPSGEQRTTTPSSVAGSMLSTVRLAPRERPAGGEGEVVVEALPQGARPPAAGGDLGRALDVAIRICEALAYIHGEGVLHRDLKPENVFVRPDGSVVLVDFGLSTSAAGRVARESVSGTTDSSGTVFYMAPEQAQGELADARADLYAFGCILFELLAGRAVFVGSTNGEVLWKHQEAQPPAPSELAGPIPPPLEELVLALLRKEPGKRLGYADVAARTLARVAADLGDLRVRPPAPMARPYIYRARLSGRGEELDELRRALKRVRKGGSGFVLLDGESGSGKTRLMLEAAAMATRAGFDVDTGACRPLLPAGESDAGGWAPLGALRGMLQGVVDRCRERGPAEGMRLLGESARLLAAYEPLVASLPVWGAAPEPVALPAAETRLRLFRHVRKLLQALATGSPRLLLVDDVQWADELTLGCLDHLLDGDGPARVLVIVACRSGEAPPPVAAMLARERVQRLAIGRLGPDGVREVVRDMLALDVVPDGFVEALRVHSEGNPLFVAEYLRLASDSGLLRRDESGMWTLPGGDDEEAPGGALGLPGSLRALLELRLEPVTPEERRVLDAAAVLGSGIDVPLLALCVEDSDPGAPVAEPLARLGLRRLVVPAQQGLRFAHDKLREVAYELVPPGRRARLHAAAARGLESRPPEDRDGAELGRHHELAGHRDRAFPFYRDAARKAEGQHAYEEATMLYAAALRVAPAAGADACDVRLDLGRRWLRAGRTEESARLLEDALRIAVDAGDTIRRARTLQLRADAARLQGRLESTRVDLVEAVEMFRRAGDAAGERDTLHGLGQAMRSLGKWDEGIVLLSEAAARADAAGDLALGARAWLEIGSGYREARDYDAALRAYDRASALGAAAGTPRARLGASFNRVTILCERGRLEEARRELQGLLPEVRRAGDRSMEGVVVSNLAIVELELGETETSLTLFQKALRMHRKAGHQLQVARLLANLSAAHVAAGDLAAAKEAARRGLEGIQASGDVLYETSALVALLEVARRERDVAAARALGARLGEIAALLTDEHTRAWSLVAESTVALLDGAHDAAVRKLSEAVEILEELDHPMDTGRALIALGQARRAAGLDPAPQVAAVEALQARLGLRSTSILGRDLEELAGRAPAR